MQNLLPFILGHALWGSKMHFVGAFGESLQRHLLVPPWRASAEHGGQGGVCARGAPVKAGLKVGAAAKHSERETGVRVSHTQTRFPIYSQCFFRFSSDSS